MKATANGLPHVPQNSSPTRLPYRICLLEDDEIMGEALSDRLELEGFACDWFKTGKAAEEVLAGGHRHFDVALCDICLPDTDGEQLFGRLQAGNAPLPPFIFITGYATVDRAVRLLKMGAHDYLTKPLDIHGLLETLHSLCMRQRPKAGEPTLGVSLEMLQIATTLQRVAQGRGSVLITGESGVGKEEVARALHRAGDPENHTPFVPVNCGALSEGLVEAELFGHVKGAFTGAVRDKKGYFELAEGGTLFLDEIGEMPPTMQVKLLRVIQERKVTRVGGETPIAVDFRLICATHQDLRKMVDDAQFREDLYYRIHVVHLHIPPLRERVDDILWLARRFLEGWGRNDGDRRVLHRSAEQALVQYPWPGNVRELKHCLERARILSPDNVLTAQHLFKDALAAPADATENASLADYLQECERRYIEESLRANAGQITRTASALGISRKNLWEKMKKLGIEG